MDFLSMLKNFLGLQHTTTYQDQLQRYQDLYSRYESPLQGEDPTHIRWKFSSPDKQYYQNFYLDPISHRFLESYTPFDTPKEFLDWRLNSLQRREM